MKIPAIRLYCGVAETAWNEQPVTPGPYACIAPIYGKSDRTVRENRVAVPATCAVLQDSGAFSDGTARRLSCAGALARQVAHAAKYGYTDQITYRASYDQLIDEKWADGVRRKSRWTEAEAWAAVDTTIQAAAYLHTQRTPGQALVLSAQGVTPRQYAACVEGVLPYLQPADLLGLGGWCITGIVPARFLPVLRATVRAVLPLVADRVAGVHIWGCCYAPALAALLWEADRWGLAVSTDSAGPQTKPAAFGHWGYAEWTDPTYRRKPPQERGADRIRHLDTTRTWLATFRASPHYPPGLRPAQSLLFEEA